MNPTAIKPKVEAKTTTKTPIRRAPPAQRQELPQVRYASDAEVLRANERMMQIHAETLKKLAK